MKDYSTPAEGILKREADGTIASQEVTEVELVNLAAVATSGSYNDLTDKPTIPTADKPTFYVSIEESQGGTLTVNKTPEEIYTAYSDGYVVYAIYKNQSLEFLLSLKLALPHITEFSGIYGVTESAVGFITVSNAGSGWTKQLSSVPISDKVVPTTRTINTKPLSSDITLTASDVGAASKDVERPYLVTFTKGTGDNYTADKTLKEIYDAVQAGDYVYGYVNTNGYWAYIPLGSCFTTGTDTISYFIYFEGPLASGNGSMVERNKLIRYISLTALNNSDATSRQYKFVSYNAVSSNTTINNKDLNGDITLNATDVNAVGLTGDQTIAGRKTFTEEATFDLGFTASGSTFTGGCIFTGQQSFNNGIVVGGQTYYRENSYISGKIHYDEDSTVDFTNATVSGLKGLLPTVTTSNNGQFLRVVNGAWAAATVENANGVSF